MSKDKEIVPIKIEGALAKMDLVSLLADTTGTPDNSDRTLYKQGKEDYWKNGDEKAESVLGIFCYSLRPTRAFWHPDKNMDGSAPTCYSFNGIQPHANSEEPESDLCRGCQWDKLGTAKQGKGKACKTKASDWIIEVPDNIEIGSDGRAYVDPARVLGISVMQYSIANRDAPGEFTKYIKKAKEIGSVPIPQAVLGRWGFQGSTSSGGTKYSAVKLDVVAALPSQEEDPHLWEFIVKMTTELMQGGALADLDRWSGTND
jgi:hypothetical protein